MGASSSATLGCVALRRAGGRRLLAVAATALALGALALLALGAPAARAQLTGMTFETGQPLTLTWGQLLKGKSVGVCNGGPATVARAHVYPVDFAFTREGNAVTPTSVLSVTRPRPVRAGECVTVRVTLASPAPIDKREYAGSLLLVAAGQGGSTRLSTTVTNLTEKPPAPAGVTEPTSLSIHSAWPWSTNSTSVLLLKAPAAGEEPLSIGKSCNGNGSDEGNCPVLGAVYQGSNVVRISVDGPSHVNRGKGVQEVPIRLHGFSHQVGTYEGTVTLPGATQAIKVKLTAKDAWYCAVLALLLAVGLTLWIQLWNGRWQPRRTLLGRADRLVENYGHRDALGVRLDGGEVAEYAAEVREAISLYAKSVVMFDSTSDAYKAIETSLKLAEDDANVFAGPGGLLPVIEQLDAQAKATTKMLHFVGVSDVPAILKAASTLLRDAPVGVGGATKRMKEAEALQPTLAAWHELAEEFVTHVVWLKLLTAVAPNDARSATPFRRDELYRCGVGLAGYRQRLFAVKGADELAALNASEGLWRTFDEIAFLAQRAGKRRPDLAAARRPPGDPQLPLKPDGDLDLERIGTRPLETVGYPTKQGDPLTFAEVLDEPAGVVIEPAKPARLPDPGRRVRQIGDAAVLLLTLIASVVTALSTFYFNKSFGSATDYLTVIVIGAAAQTLLKGVLNQTSILMHDFAPDTPPVPAKVLAPTTPGAASS